MLGRLGSITLAALPGRQHKLPRDVRARLRLARHERVLAASPDAHGRWIIATSRALYVPAGEALTEPGSSGPPPDGPPIVPEAYDQLRWERVERAEWDQDAEVLRISELAPFGEPVPYRVLRFERSERLLELIRERVTASVIVSQHVPIQGADGVRVVARRPPGTAEELTWSLVFDDAIDPSDPKVLDAAERALESVRSQIEAS